MGESRFFFDWVAHPNFVEELKTRWANGESAGQIAIALKHGLTRNAVMGKINRLGMRRISSSVKRERIIELETPPPPKTKTIFPSESPIPTVPPETFVVNGCRYMEGYPTEPGWQFCGNKTKGSGSWCEYHYSIVYDLAAMAKAKKRNHG